MTASRPELPSWQEAQDQAVTHATAAEDEQPWAALIAVSLFHRD
jgi:hypothetical protein